MQCEGVAGEVGGEVCLLCLSPPGVVQERGFMDQADAH